MKEETADQTHYSEKMSLSDLADRLNRLMGESIAKHLMIKETERFGVMDIYLLRHGETDWNLKGRLQGHEDIDMNPKGIMQIEKAAEIFAGFSKNVDVIISSPLARARKSAEIVADRLDYKTEDIVTEPLFIERGFGLGEGLDYEERKKRFTDDTYPGMEPLEELIERAGLALDTILKKYNDQNVIIAAHGAILKALLTAVTEGKIVYEGDSVKVEPGSIHLIRYEKGKAALFQWNKDTSDFTEIKY